MALSNSLTHARFPLAAAKCNAELRFAAVLVSSIRAYRKHSTSLATVSSESTTGPAIAKECKAVHPASLLPSTPSVMVCSNLLLPLASFCWLPTIWRLLDELLLPTTSSIFKPSRSYCIATFEMLLLESLRKTHYHLASTRHLLPTMCF